MTTKKTLKVARETALTIGAVLGALCIILAIAAPAFGMRLLVFTSGSMSPTIETGAVAVSRSVAGSEIRVGDIVSVNDSQGRRITHRVTDASERGDTVELRLQGDANGREDSETYTVTKADRVVWHLDRAGYLVDALATPYAVFAAGAGAVGLLVLAFRRRTGVHRDQSSAAAGGQMQFDDETEEPPRLPRHGRQRAEESARRSTRSGDGIVAAKAIAVTGLASAALVAAGVFSGSMVTPTLAAFTDSAEVTGSVDTMTLVAPTTMDCTNGEFLSGKVYVGWPAVAGAPAGYQYLMETYATDPGNPITTSVIDASSSDKIVTTVSRGDLPGSGTYHVAVYGSLDGTSWRSLDSTSLSVNAGWLGTEINC